MRLPAFILAGKVFLAFTLALAVSGCGDMSAPYSNTAYQEHSTPATAERAAAETPAPGIATPVPPGGPVVAVPQMRRRPLIVIRFINADVNYEDALRGVLDRVLAKKADARFNLVAVSPAMNDAEEMSRASSEAVRHSEEVMRSLTRIGLSVDRIIMNAATSPEVHNSEVHLYLE